MMGLENFLRARVGLELKKAEKHWSRMSLYAVALRFPFTRTKGPSPNHEKQPQTIIPPEPNFTVCAMHSGR